MIFFKENLLRKLIIPGVQEGLEINYNCIPGVQEGLEIG